jgi:hypothetical protein
MKKQMGFVRNNEKDWALLLEAIANFYRDPWLAYCGK